MPPAAGPLSAVDAALARAGLVTPAQRAWAWYDWANSAYFTTVITAVFPSFFATYAAAGLDPASATTRFGLITTLSTAVIAVLAPFLGAVADRAAIRKPLMAGFIAIGVLSCASMVFIGEGAIGLASALFVIGNISASGAIVLYDALLPHVAGAEDGDRVSSAGYALGYVGGGLLLLLNLAWILQPTTFGFPDTTTAVKASFLAVAVWWAVFSLPLFRRVPEPPAEQAPGDERGTTVVADAWFRLADTFRHVRRYRQAFLFFLAVLLYQDGIQTIIRMASVYGAEIGIPQPAQIGAFVLVQFVGIPFALIFGALARRIGTKRALFIAIGVYALATVLGYFMDSVTDFFLLAALVGTVQGGAQALSRSMFARMIPVSQSAEFFGFFAIAERFATVLGPLVFTISVALTGSSRSAVLVILLFFVAGAWLLSRVDEAEGIRAAREGGSA